MDPSRYYNPAEELLEPQPIQQLQRQKLARLLQEITGPNRFYTRKFAGLAFDPLRDPLEKLPFTTRKELELDQLENPRYGSNLTYPFDRYCRLHQTSGSVGRPMRWLDTRESWNWFKDLWGTIYRAAGLRPEDRLMFPFSFGPFIGFWAAFESALHLGNLAVAAGGMTTTGRLQLLLDHEITFVCCTPTYALRMAEVARAEGIDLAGSKVARLVVAAEPGGSIPEIRNRIESAWGARVYDHTGMTEIGSLGFECHEAPGGVHLNEGECIAEVIDPATGRLVPDGELGELVLTNLGRWGSPLIRYRTNDQVRITRDKCRCGRWFARMEGGIVGRYDDMITVRGNNVFPAGVESVIRRFPEIAEFRVTIVGTGALAEMKIEIEPTTPDTDPTLCDRLARAVHGALSFRAQVTTVTCGSLPRFEMKARRFIRTTS
jgi:phenylacetate-CoA ligase